jgi:hypothetical protein
MVFYHALFFSRVIILFLCSRFLFWNCVVGARLTRSAT